MRGSDHKDDVREALAKAFLLVGRQGQTPYEADEMSALASEYDRAWKDAGGDNKKRAQAAERAAFLLRHQCDYVGADQKHRRWMKSLRDGLEEWGVPTRD